MTVGLLVFSAASTSSAELKLVTCAPWSASTRSRISRASGSSSTMKAWTPSSCGSAIGSPGCGLGGRMDALRAFLLDLHDRQRQLDGEGRAAALALARRRGSCRRAARPAACRSPGPARGRRRRACVELSRCEKRSKTCGRKLGRDADAGVADAQLDVRIHALQQHLDLAALGRELDRVGQQVPHHLLQARGVGVDDGARPDRASPAGGCPWRRPPAGPSRRRPRRRRAASTCCRSSRILPVMIRLRSSRSSISCTWARALRSITSMARRCARRLARRRPSAAPASSRGWR